MRTMEEVNKDFAESCLKAGETQYQIKIYEASLLQLNQKLQLLSQEAFNIQSVAPAKPAPVEPPAHSPE